MNTQLPASTNGERRSGRTSRQIVWAICAMLRGKAVIFVSSNEASSRAHYQLAKDWLVTNGFHGFRVSDTARRTLYMPEGSLQFRSAGACFLGLRNVEVVKDHYVLELEAIEAQRLARLAAVEQVKVLIDRFGITERELGRLCKVFPKEFKCN